MTFNLTLTSDQVKQAVEATKKEKPVYSDILDFYGRIFELQELSKSRIQIQPLQISQELCAVKAREKFPLIEIKDFAFDEAEAGKLFIAICNLAKESNPKLAADAAAILNAIGKEIIPAELVGSLLDGKAHLCQKIAGEIEISATTLGFFSYNSILPSLSVCADQLSIYLDREEPWLKGYCPICGSPPTLSILDSDGKRSMICSFCWHPWSVKRIYCPFCENLNSETLHYFYSEEEKKFRVDLCDSCKKYIKTLDARKTESIIYPPLEKVSSLHLDYKARELGYESGIRLFWQD